MSSETRQRRGLTNCDAVTSTATEESSAVDSNRRNESADERLLEAAMGRVIAARRRLDDLHRGWRGYLLRMSLMAMLLAVLQCRAPAEVCIRDIKDHNAALFEDGAGSTTAAIGFSGMIAMVLRNGLCEYVGVFQSALVAYYLGREDVTLGDFTPHAYMMSAVLVPAQLSLFFQTRDLVGCAGAAAPLGGGEEGRGEARQFPISVVFHVIVTVSCWFMKMGRNKSDEQVGTVESLKRQVEETKRKASTRKGKGKGRK